MADNEGFRYKVERWMVSAPWVNTITTFVVAFILGAILL